MKLKILLRLYILVKTSLGKESKFKNISSKMLYLKSLTKSHKLAQDTSAQTTDF